MPLPTADPRLDSERNEAERLAALHGLGILDTAPAEAFDRVTRLAASLLAVPIVLVSLVDETRQWFKSRFGFDAKETPLEISFCAHAVHARTPLIVPDTTLDTRFAINPLVTGASHFRAYMGVPLLTRAGHAIGTLCAIDRRPREFDAVDLQKLRDFASIIEDELHARESAERSEHVLRFATEREQLFRDTFEQAGVGITHTSLSGELLRINKHACDRLGYTAAELHNVSFIDITHPDDIASNVGYFHQMTSGAIDNYRLEKRFLRKDGTYLWTHVSVALKRSAAGRPDFMIAVIEDIAVQKQLEADLVGARDSLLSQVAEQTARLKDANHALRSQVKNALESERELRQARDRLRSITDHIPALIGYWSRSLRCEFANEMHRAWFGHDPQTLLGTPMRDCLGDALFRSAEPHIRKVLEGSSQRFESSWTKPDGATVVSEVRFIPHYTDTDVVRGLYMLATDITQARNIQRALEQANAQLTQDSVTDYLTGLANRRIFSERSEEACTRFRDPGEGYGLIVIDLDDFKQINDLYGHDVGDEALRVVGRLLKADLRNPRDVAARMGGEEFAILCFGDLDEQLLNEIAERIRSRIQKETIRAAKAVLSISASFGTALANSMDVGSKNIYSRADGALYEAKAAGKNRVVFGKLMPHGSTGKFRGFRALARPG